MLRTLIPFYRNTVRHRKAGFVAYAIISSMRTLFTPEEAGKRLRISESTVYRLWRAQKLKAFKVDGGLRFTEEEILAFIERHREPVEPEQQQTRTVPTPHNAKMSFN